MATIIPGIFSDIRSCETYMGVPSLAKMVEGILNNSHPSDKVFTLRIVTEVKGNLEDWWIVSKIKSMAPQYYLPQIQTCRVGAKSDNRFVRYLNGSNIGEVVKIHDDSNTIFFQDNEPSLFVAINRVYKEKGTVMFEALYMKGNIEGNIEEEKKKFEDVMLKNCIPAMQATVDSGKAEEKYKSLLS